MRKHQVRAVVAGVACVAALVLGWAAWSSTNAAHAQAVAKATPVRIEALAQTGDKEMSPEQAQKAWARSLAVQAATFGSQIVAMYNLRATIAFGPKSKAPPGKIWLFDAMPTPKVQEEAGYVTPNVNVLYGFGFADLGQQPYILTAPDSHGRYYMIEIVDMWTNAFAYPAGEHSGYKGGKFALVGPGWKGKLPADVKRIDCPTRWIEIQPRVHVKNEADLPGAQKVLNGVKLQSLAEYNGGPAPAPVAYDYEVPKVNPKVASSQMQFVDPLQFWSIFSAAMNENPPPKSQIEGLLPVFRYLGIELGKPWNPKTVNPIFLHEMKLASQAIGPMMNQAIPLMGSHVVNGWTIPPYNVGLPEADYMLGGAVAVVGTTANATAEGIYYLEPIRKTPLYGK
jgi:hypothetical protein